MRTNSSGRKFTLKADLSDILCHNLPETYEAAEDYTTTKDFDKLLDMLLDVIDDHIDQVVRVVKDITS